MGIRSTVLCWSALGFVLIGNLEAQKPSTLPQQVGEVGHPQGMMSAGRPMTPDDLFSIRSYTTTRVSPDGEAVAVVINSSAPGVSGFEGDSVTSNRRTELWVASRDGHSQRRTIPERSNEVSQWNPIWSPDGQHLAFFSNNGQKGAFLQVWDRATGRVRQLAISGIDISTAINIGFESLYRGDCVLWLDNTHLIAAILPEGAHPLAFDDRNAHIPVDGMSSEARGLNSTAITASSPPRPRSMPEAQLGVFDTRTGSFRTIAYVPVWLTQGKLYVVLSADKSWAAVVTEMPPDTVNPESPFAIDNLSWGRLGIASLTEDNREVRWIDSVRLAAYYPAIRWEKNGSSFAIIARQRVIHGPTNLAVVDAPSAVLRTRAVLDSHRLEVDERLASKDPGWGIQDLAWLPNGKMAVKTDHQRITPEGPDYLWWTVSDQNATRLTTEEEALVKDEGPSKRDAVKLETSETGRLYEKDAAGHETTIFPDLNPQLTKIAPAQSMNFEYKSATGETLHAHLVLPYGYVKGRHYPTVVSVYAGDVLSGNERAPGRGDESSLLPGRGYAVLEPSMPLTPVGVPGDPMLHLNDGVDPAVDRAIELGIVDPDRLAVMGSSYGGYGVFGLLTQTHRYRAGIAMMAVSDMAAFYGQFGAGLNYIDPEDAAKLGPWMSESSQLRMGVPPWVDPDRYVRNSPFYAADKITTPLLIVSGDLDRNTGAQDDAMFTALYRQGKRAEYVRYLGEGHGLESPANIRDLWQRTFSWLDEYLGETTVKTP
jgi:dienelactone hydrolase